MPPVTKSRPKQQRGRHSGVVFHHNPFQLSADHTIVTRTGQQATTIPLFDPQPQSKKRKLDEMDVEPAQPDPSTLPKQDLPKTSKPIRNQKESVYTREFEKHQEDVIRAMFAVHEGPDAVSLCRCGHADARFRCQDCDVVGSSLLCKDCILASHQCLSLHWFEEWNGAFFVRRDLSELGGVRCLGHSGERCKNLEPTAKPTELTVVHVNGVHTLHVHQCWCVGPTGHMPLSKQLLQTKLFPASFERPATAFTFEVLKVFHIYGQTSKGSAQGFWEILCRRTNNASFSNVPNRYKELLRVSHWWRHLVMLKRAGHLHNINDELPQRVHGCFASRCFACPEVGFNLPPGWEETPDDQKHLITLFLSADGNFRLVLKKKTDDPDDFSLNEGNAYFVKESEYQEYLKKVKNNTEKSTCARLKVVNAQNVLKFQNCVVTGVVSIQCARHGMHMPTGLVDLQKGERFANVDYALAHALQHHSHRLRKVFTYDVSCQYCVNLVERFERWFPDQSMQVDKEKFLCLVPKMHAQGHKDDCQYLYSLNYTDHVGRTCGELIEQGWADSNRAANSTKEMTKGYRADFIDDIFADSNWRKTERLIATLPSSYASALKMATKTARILENQNVTDLQISGWMKLSREPVKRDGMVESVFRSKYNKVRTQAKALESLLADTGSQAVSVRKSTQAYLLHTGLQLATRQFTLRWAIQNEDSNIVTKRACLLRDINSWREQQLVLLSDLQDIIMLEPTDNLQPESQKLFLPSDFNADERTELRLATLAMMERELREGQAHDILAALRKAVQATGVQEDFGMMEVRGQHAKTRNAEEIKKLKANARGCAAQYRVVRDALLRLGMSEEDATFKPLLDEELWMKNPHTVHRLGDGTREEPWYWHMGPSGIRTDADMAAWELDAQRVKWFRALADAKRWKEESEILDAEWDRTIRSCTKMAEVWRAVEDRNVAKLGRGAKSYALRQAAMYDGMKIRLQVSEKRVMRDSGGSGVEAEVVSHQGG